MRNVHFDYPGAISVWMQVEHKDFESALALEILYLQRSYGVK